ncbi:sucrase ferredoxin [Gordonia jinhuaensis]|nr:sucrase ferredoxin [Gordonia jinhuaensis]
MYGTASAGFSWLMLEVSGPWGPSAFMQSPTVIDPELGRQIVRRAERAGLRIVAIRRPGRRAPTPRWRWFVANARPGEERMVGGECDSAEGYLTVPLDGTGGYEITDPLVAVCAHGKHDQCCAVRGRGVAAAIADRYPDWTWECSHLGGDRFAATMMLLPHGLCYGRADSADEPANIVELYTLGRVVNSLLRGRTSLPHAVQAAQYFARKKYGDNRIGSFTEIDVAHGDAVVVVVLASASPGRTLRVTLREELSEPILTMCTAEIPGRVRQFQLVSIDEADVASPGADAPHRS